MTTRSSSRCTETPKWISCGWARPEPNTEIEILVNGHFPGDQYLIERGEMHRFKVLGEDRWTHSFHGRHIYKGKPELHIVNAEFWRYVERQLPPELPWAPKVTDGDAEYESWAA